MDIKNDPLRIKFTAWLKVVVKRAKIDYIRRLNRHSNEISIEDKELTDKLVYEPSGAVEEPQNGFEFDDHILSSVFKKLAPKRRRLLELLYVHNMSPEEAAEELHCSVQHVYNLRSISIKELKRKLDEVGGV